MSKRKIFTIVAMLAMLLTCVPHLAIGSVRYRGFICFGGYAIIGIIIPAVIECVAILKQERSKTFTFIGVGLTLAFNIAATVMTYILDEQPLAFVSLGTALLICIVLLILNIVIPNNVGAVTNKYPLQKKEAEQIFGLLWVKKYNELEFDEATTKIAAYLEENGYLKGNFTKTTVEQIVAYLWVKKYNELPFEEANVKICEYLTENKYIGDESENGNGSPQKGGKGPKPLNGFQAIARFNTNCCAEIAGPFTGFSGLRVKRISKIKQDVVMWEKGCYDVIVPPGAMEAPTVKALNFMSARGGNCVIYSSYVDVIIDNTLNRLKIDVAKVMSDTDAYLRGTPVPVVIGWVKDVSKPNDRDEHFDDAICPEGYVALTEGNMVNISRLRVGQKLRDIGLPDDLIPQCEYLRKGPFKFTTIE